MPSRSRIVLKAECATLINVGPTVATLPPSSLVQLRMTAPEPAPTGSDAHPRIVSFIER